MPFLSSSLSLHTPGHGVNAGMSFHPLGLPTVAGTEIGSRTGLHLLALTGHVTLEKWLHSPLESPFPYLLHGDGSS